MKTNKRTLTLVLAVALMTGMLIPAPTAKAGDREALVVAGAILGGVLGYIVGDANDDCGRTRIETHVGYRAPVVIHEPTVVVYEPVVVRPRPVQRVVIVNARPQGHAYGWNKNDRKHGEVVVRRDCDDRHDDRRDDHRGGRNRR
jgi:hypothetical protein